MNVTMEMKYVRRSRFRRLVSRLVLRRRGSDVTSLAMMATGGGVPIRQTKLAPDGVEISEDVSAARWVEESLSALNFSTVRSLLPNGFPAYARVFHPAYLNGDEEQPVRWSTVASWTGRTVHPLMQFQRVAGLREGPHVNTPDPRGVRIRRSGRTRKRSAVPWSKRSGASPQPPTAATSAYGKAVETSTLASTRPVLV